MSTIANAVFSNNDSDSENDPDFVPADDAPSGTVSRLEDDEVGRVIEEDGLATKGEGEGEGGRKEKEREARAALWAEFQDSVSSSSSSSKTLETASVDAPKLVKIEKRHRFAGEDVIEVVEVAEDSQEAKTWPRWRPEDDKDASDTADAPVREATSSAVETSTSNHNPAPGPSSSSMITKPKAKPGPRKPKTALPSLPTGKPKKLSTLEKSAMDWRTHVSEQDGGTVDEMARNRRAGGGGYLEKMEFMDRVEGRREEIFEKEKGAKRRRV